MEICKECIKKDLHCCKKMPLFDNFEIVKLIEDGILEKLGYSGKIVIWRYHEKHEVFTVLYKNEKFKDYKDEKKECIFFDKEKGCKLGEYMPRYCKMYREKNPVLYCSYIDTGLNGDMEILKEQKKKLNYFKEEEYYYYVFKDFLKRFRKNSNFRKITKDEIILALAIHSLNCNIEELTKENILTKTESKIFDIEKNGEVFIYRNIRLKPLSDNPFIIEYTRKFNYILNNIYNNKTPLEIEILIQKTQSVINGIDKLYYNDKDLEKDFKGFLFANTILYNYKKNFKNKNKFLKGLVINEKDLENVEDLIIEKLENRGIDAIEEIEKSNEFANKFIRRILKLK